MKFVWIFIAVLVFTLTPIITNAEALLTNDDFSKVSERTDNYVGMSGKFSGEIQNIQDYGDYVGYVFQVGDLSNLWVESKLESVLDENDCYIVEGKISGTNTLVNNFDRKILVPYLELEKFQEISCLEAKYPSTHSIKIDETQQKGSVKVTVEKIDLTDDHVRVLLSLENLSPNLEITMRTYDSIIVQDKKQFTTTHVFAEHDKIESTIPSGIIEDGYLIFDPIKPSDFELRLYFSERNDDYFKNQYHEFIFKEDFSINIASFVELGVDPQTYVDRYNNEPTYKKWFDTYYPQYSSIEAAVGLADPPKERTASPKTTTVSPKETTYTPKTNIDPPKAKTTLASFVKSGVNPQTYVDRYNNEPTYKKWFDTYYPQYSSIEEAVGLGNPTKSNADTPKGKTKLAQFVESGVNPQEYVDRYNNEPIYKKWFDTNYPEYDSIYDAVGIGDSPKAKTTLASFVKSGVNPQEYVNRYNNEPIYKKWFDTNYPQYSSIEEAVGLNANTIPK